MTELKEAKSSEDRLREDKGFNEKDEITYSIPLSQASYSLYLEFHTYSMFHKLLNYGLRIFEFRLGNNK